MSTFVVPFNKENLFNLVQKSVPESTLATVQKEQVEYVFRYLNSFSPSVCKTIVYEPDYVDRMFLIDHSSYYNRCFHSYANRCARIHFFDSEFNLEQLEQAIIDNDQEHTLTGHYIGFTTVTPLPNAVFGNTCLKPYQQYVSDSSGNDSKSCVGRNVRVNLYGLELEVWSSPFVEQDQITSACASAALWSFLSINPDYHGEVPAPSEITTLANGSVNGSFPSQGLTYEQMTQVLKKLNLEPRYQEANTADQAKIFHMDLYSYLSKGYPILIGAKLLTGQDELSVSGRHAVLINGYSIDKSSTERVFLNQRVSSVLLHDDQQGPYLKGRILSYNEIENLSFEDSGRDSTITDSPVIEVDIQSKGKDIKQYYIVENYYISTYHKVRLPSEIVYFQAKSFADIYKRRFALAMLTNMTREEEESFQRQADEKAVEIVRFLTGLLSPELTVSLKNNNELKADIRNREEDPVNSSKLEYLTKIYPKYLWVVDFKFQQKSLFTLVFDATDTRLAKSLMDVISWDDKAEDILFDGLERTLHSLLDEQFDKPERAQIFAENIIETRKKDPLDEKFGRLRAPYKIDANEIQEDNRAKVRGDIEKVFASDGFSPELSTPYIWVIDQLGALIVAKDVAELGGHPTLTGGKLCRIAGELRIEKGNSYKHILKVNGKSGRYYGPYESISRPDHYQNACSYIARLLNLDIEQIGLTLYIDGQEHNYDVPLPWAKAHNS